MASTVTGSTTGGGGYPNPNVYQTGYQGTPTTTSSGQSSSSQQSSSTSNPVQTEQSELSALISQLAEGYGNQVLQYAQSQVAPNTAVTDATVGNYLQGAQTANQLAGETAADYNNIYRPEDAQLAQEAGQYSSGARQQFNAGQAAAGAIQGADTGIQSSMAQLQGYGVNPSAGAFGQLIASQKTAAGAAAAGAGTTAAQNTAAAGRSLLQTSVGQGNNVGALSNSANSTAATNLSGAESAQLGNSTTNTSNLTSPNAYLQTAQNMVQPGTSTTSESSGSSQSTQSGNSQALSPTTGITANYQGGVASGGAIPAGMAHERFADGGVPMDEDDSTQLQPDPSQATQGGHIPQEMSPSKGAITDDVNAHVNANEFVIPRDVALWQGQKFFQTVVQKSRAEMQAPGLAKPSMGASPMDRGQAQFKSDSAQPQSHFQGGTHAPAVPAGHQPVGNLPIQPQHMGGFRSHAPSLHSQGAIPA